MARRLLCLWTLTHQQNLETRGANRMGANHAGERKRKKLKNTKKILRTQLAKAKEKAPDKAS